MNQLSNKDRQHNNNKRRGQTGDKYRTDHSAKCRNCEGTYPHEGGKTACGKLNHFQSICLQSKQRSNMHDAPLNGTNNTLQHDNLDDRTYVR